MKIPRILFVPILIACIVAISVLVGFISHWAGAYSPTAWGFFTLIGIMGGLIGFTFLRQLWWWITKTGDYEDHSKKG